MVVKKEHLLVTISRELGAGGAALGQRIATRLSIRYLDRAILHEAAERLRESEETLEPIEERGVGVWERIMRGFGAGTMDAGVLSPSVPANYDRRLFATEAEIIRRVADEYDAVIVGRGGFRLLQGRPGLLSVFLHAPVAFRQERLRASHSEIPPEEILAAIRRSDQDRDRFLRSMMDLTWADARNYHVCLDASRLGLEAAADIVIRMAEEVRARLAAPAAGGIS